MCNYVLDYSLYGEVGMPRTGRPRLVDAAYCLDLKARDPKWTDARIAEEIYKGEVGRSAVSRAISNYKARNGERKPPEFPWAVRSKHARGSVYQTLVTLRHWEEHVQLTDVELVALQTFLRLLDLQEVIVAYHPKTGFHWLPRRPGDSESYFQVREFDEAGQPILG
jgi:hypothetical protein